LVAALTTYFYCLVRPYFAAHDIYSVLGGAFIGLLRRYQYLGVFGFIGLSSVAAVLGGRARSLNALAWFWIALAGWSALSAVWSIQGGGSALYAGLLAAAVIALLCFWSLPAQAIRWAALLAAIVSIVLIAGLFRALPVNSRSLGGITPNYLGHFGFAILVLLYISGRFRVIGWVIAAALLAFSQSRTVAGGAAVFFVVHHVLLPRVSDRATLVRLALVGAIPALLVLLLFNQITAAASSGLTHLLGVAGDTARTTGFSGRSALWAEGMRLFLERPILGYGFRTSVAPVGSGVLNLAIDLGLVGVALFAASYATSLGRLACAYADRHREHDRVALSYLAGMLPILLVEPNYLNFFHPTSFLMIAMLVRAATNPTTRFGSSNALT